MLDLGEPEQAAYHRHADHACKTSNRFCQPGQLHTQIIDWISTMYIDCSCKILYLKWSLSTTMYNPAICDGAAFLHSLSWPSVVQIAYRSEK